MIPELVAKHAGLVMAHAAAIASVLKPGELICPFAVVTKGDNRQSIDFEAETQDEAIVRAWASLTEYQGYIDLWAMAREGLIAGESGKDDVLVVAAWTHGMPEPVVFSQRFCPTSRGDFSITGPVMVRADLDAPSLRIVGEWFLQGVAEHPQGERWGSWLVPNKPLQPIAREDARSS